MKTQSEIEAIYTKGMGINHSAAILAVYQAGAYDQTQDEKNAPLKAPLTPQQRQTTWGSGPDMLKGAPTPAAQPSGRVLNTPAHASPQFPPAYPRPPSSFRR
jgi:hypothetical protein